VAVLDRGVESAACLRGDGFERDWRPLPICGDRYRKIRNRPLEAVLISLLVTGASVWIAWRDVKISARLMLWIEATSMFMIITLVVLVLVRTGHIDWEQLHLRGMTGSGLRLGLVLALFSFVGFESATTLGAEARDPLKTIPRAVIS
jgi:amino acid transporter